MIWGAIENDVKQYRLHDGQRDVLQAPQRFKAAIAGTGGGKTAMGPIWVMDQLKRILEERDVAREPILGLTVAPTYQILSRATMPTLIQMFADTDLEGEWKESRNQYILPDGLGIIWTLSADRPGGIEGGQFDFCWIDEGGQIKYESWVAIQGRLGLRQGKVLITTTPYGQNWLYHKFFKFAERGDPDYYVRQWGSIANPAYPKEEVERVRRTMSPQRFAMRYEGRFVKMAGLVYPDMSSCVKKFNLDDLRQQARKEDVDGSFYGGLDWGWNDPFCALAGWWSGRALYVWYERYKRLMTVEDHGRALPRAPMYFADGSRPDSIATLRKAGLVVRPNKIKSISDGIDAVNEWIYSDRLVVHPNCLALLAEVEEYSYPQKDDEIEGDLPIDDFNHACDALRYMLANMTKRGVLRRAA